jgi:hypothetical protein
MAKVNIVPCMAYDAICFLETRTWDEKDNLPAEEIEIFEKIDAIVGDKFGDECFGMSNMCMYISMVIENKGIESYTLDDLINLLLNFDGELVKSKIPDTFLKDFHLSVIDMMMSEGWERLSNQLRALKEAGFEEIWNTEVLPKVQAEVNSLENNIKDIDLNKLFNDIQTMKNGELLTDINIYVSYFSYPIAFGLYNGSYLTCTGGKMDIFSLTAHELMHGFMTDELQKLYIDYVNGDEYLTEQHRRLIEDMWSGDEEEFVTAAEYYLTFLHGRKSKKELLDEARARYGGCMPTSVSVFDLLTEKQQDKVPSNYAAWLVDRFKAEQLPKSEVMEHLDIIAPPKEYDAYCNKLFSRFRKIIAKIETMQKEYNGSFMEKLECITGEKFTESTEKSVEFGQRTIPLPNAKKVSVIQKDRLFINVAEFEDYHTALMDRVTHDGGFITPPALELKEGQFYHLWFVCICTIPEIPAALASTFVKNNLRVTVTQRCEPHVFCEPDNGDYDLIDKYILEIKDETFAALDIVESIIIQL